MTTENMEQAAEVSAEEIAESVVPETEAPQQEEEVVLSVDEAVKAAVAQQEEKYLRLLAEYDNFRKRSQREREAAWNNSKADTAAAFLPVFDNLTRALKQETADAAYAKGVQMTMDQLKTILGKLGIEEIEAVGQPFNPELHNAVMHIEDETLGANVVAEVFETGFRSGEKVIRFAMVKVAN